MGPLSKPVVVCRDSNEVDSQPHGRLAHHQRPGRRESYVRNLAPRGGAPSGLGAFRERKRAGENTARHAFPPSSSEVFVHLFGRVRLPISAPGPLRWAHRGPWPFVAENWQLRRGPCLLNQMTTIEMLQPSLPINWTMILECRRG